MIKIYFKISSTKKEGYKVEGLFRDHPEDDNIFIPYLTQQEISTKLIGLLSENHNLSFQQIRKDQFKKYIETWNIKYYSNTKMYLIYQAGTFYLEPKHSYVSKEYAIYQFLKRIYPGIKFTTLYNIKKNSDEFIIEIKD